MVRENLLPTVHMLKTTVTHMSMCLKVANYSVMFKGLNMTVVSVYVYS